MREITQITHLRHSDALVATPCDVMAPFSPICRTAPLVVLLLLFFFIFGSLCHFFCLFICIYSWCGCYCCLCSHVSLFYICSSLFALLLFLRGTHLFCRVIFAVVKFSNFYVSCYKLLLHLLCYFYWYIYFFLSFLIVYSFVAAYVVVLIIPWFFFCFDCSLPY